MIYLIAAYWLLGAWLLCRSESMGGFTLTNLLWPLPFICCAMLAPVLTWMEER